MHGSGNQVVEIVVSPNTITPSDIFGECVLLTATNLGSEIERFCFSMESSSTSGHNDSPIELYATVVNCLLQASYIKGHEENK